MMGSSRMIFLHPGSVGWLDEREGGGRRQGTREKQGDRITEEV